MFQDCFLCWLVCVCFSFCLMCWLGHDYFCWNYRNGFEIFLKIKIKFQSVLAHPPLHFKWRAIYGEYSKSDFTANTIHKGLRLICVHFVHQREKCIFQFNVQLKFQKMIFFVLFPKHSKRIWTTENHYGTIKVIKSFVVSITTHSNRKSLHG